MGDSDYCRECDRALHTVFWCRACGGPCYSFACWQRHRAEHRANPPGDRPANGEKPGPAK